MTLGIPRLRELLMTAAQSIKTPVMTLPLRPHCSRADADVLATRLRRLRLAEVTTRWRWRRRMCWTITGRLGGSTASACASPTLRPTLPRPASPSSRCRAMTVILAPSRGLEGMSQQA